jgi:hypothetical protein
MALQPFLGPWPHISVSKSFYTDGRTPWTSYQPVARPLPIHRTTQTQKNAQTINIHASSRIRTYDHGIRVSEDSSCLRRLGYSDRHLLLIGLWTNIQRTLKLGINTLKRGRDGDRLRAGRPRGRSSSPGKVKNFLFSTLPRPALGSTQPPIQWVPGGSFPEGKAAGAWSWPLTSN